MPPTGFMNSTNHADFIPEIWLQEALGYIREQILALKLIARDSEMNGEFEVGETVNITRRGVLEAKDKTEGGDVVLQAPLGSKIPVSLSNHFEVAFSPTSFLKAVAQGNLEDGYIADAISILIEKVESSIHGVYALMTQTVGTAGVAIDEAVILALREKFNINKAPQNDRNLMVSPKDDTALLKIDRLTRADAVGSGSRIPDGAIGRAHGINIFPSNLGHSVAGAPPTYHNIAFSKLGIVLVSRPLKRIEGAMSTQVQDDETGLILRLTKGYNSTKNEDQIVLDMLWGVHTMRSEWAIDVLS